MTYWRKCTAERYDEMLGVLPPYCMTGFGFLVGEPSSHRVCKVSGDVRPDYAAFVRINGQHYEGPNMTAPEWRTLNLNAVLDGAAVSDGTMTQERWNAMTPAQRDAARDNSDLTPQLIGLEGWRVEVLAPDRSTVSGFKPRRFIVGRSTGWKPCHLEISTRRSFGGSPAAKEYRQVRKLEKVR